MSLRTGIEILMFLWVSSEILLGVSRRATPGKDHISDRGSGRILWFVIVGSVVFALVLRTLAWGRIPFSPTLLDGLALLFLLGGIGLRWWAILSLGHSFTTNVAVRPEQNVISTGPYKWIRHPAYAGMLAAFLGCGSYFGSWLSLGVLLLPISAAILYRVRVEEAALIRGLGEEYEAYRKRTKTLLPWIL